MEVYNSFTALEILLMGTITTLVGGIIFLARYFYSYLVKTNKERAEEIKATVQVQTELKGVIEHNNYLVEHLPERLSDKIKAALKQ